MHAISQPCLFLPGTLCDERVWLQVWQHMSLSSGMRQYVPIQWANDLSQMLSLTIDRIEQNTAPVLLVGYSMGGYIAALSALESTNVASLTLVGYNPIGLSEAEQSQRQLIIKAIDQGKYSVTSKQRLKSFLTHAELSLSEIAGTIDAMATDLGAASLKAQFQATTPRKDLTQSLSKTRFPVHFVTAQQDKIASAHAIETFAKQHPKMTVESVGDTAHMMLLTRPEACARSISDFIHSNTQG